MIQNPSCTFQRSHPQESYCLSALTHSTRPPHLQLSSRIVVSMKLRRVSSSSEGSSYPRGKSNHYGKSNTRIHEAKAVGLEKETPSLILAIGELLDDAVKCNIGGQLQTTINACDGGPESNRRTPFSSETCRISEGLRDSPQLFAKSIDDYDDDTSMSTEGSQALRQAPTWKRRGMMYQLHCPFGNSCDSEGRDDSSMSRSVDTGTTELYDTGHRRVDSMSSEDCVAQILRSVSTEASGAKRTGSTASKESGNKKHRGLSSEASVTKVGRLQRSDVSFARDGANGATKVHSNGYDIALGGLCQGELDRKASLEMLKPFTKQNDLLPEESSIEHLQCLSRLSEIALASADNLDMRSEVIQDNGGAPGRRETPTTNDSKSPLMASAARIRQLTDEQVRLSSTTVGGYSRELKAKKDTYGLAPKELVTIQCSKASTAQTQGATQGDYSSPRHSTTVSRCSDGGPVVDSSIEVFFENQYSGSKDRNHALRRLVRVEYQSLRILCKALSLGSVHVQNANSKYFKGWFSPRRGRC